MQVVHDLLCVLPLLWVLTEPIQVELMVLLTIHVGVT